jgi:hypothetical protein
MPNRREVENQGGAGGTLPPARSPAAPDGYTFIFQEVGVVGGHNPIVYKRLTYDPVGGFAPSPCSRAFRWWWRPTWRCRSRTCR